MENGERLQQLDRSNNHALLWQERNGSVLLHSRSNDVALLSSFISNYSSPSDEKNKAQDSNSWFWNFCQFLAKTIVSQDHEELEVSYFSDADNLCEQHPEVILLYTSILFTVKVIK
ncbi:hypothetical protein Ahy_A06g029113 [Arachis hypogaea]|uniref:Uncharacterized protein n=1 Tax=Arachis hypogaea TaxID=3818 RepID=A0A445CSL5_ARAHY|nr:hypothetical protein Ahy_A06g029113 [Arachis hypogaea]